MEIIIRQTIKELFLAAFDILSSEGSKMGDIVMRGALGSREGCFQVRFDGMQIQMQPTDRRTASEAAGSLIQRSPFRPYIVAQNDSRGVLFHDQISTGFLKSAGYHLLSLGGAVYYLYFVGFGEKGICAPVYRGNTYIAEIRKDCKVLDDLHIFRISVEEPADLLASILLCCYMYVITYYKAGEKVMRGVQKNIYITKNDYLLAKCRTQL